LGVKREKGRLGRESVKGDVQLEKGRRTVILPCKKVVQNRGAQKTLGLTASRRGKFNIR